MRRLLTNKILLGAICIVIGMAPLLTLVNIVGSSKDVMAKEFNRNGSRLISVKFNAPATYRDFDDLKQQMPELKTIIPVSKSSIQLSSYKADSSVELKAVGYDYWKLSGLNMIKGKFISKAQEKSSQNVIVIDDLTADKLFSTTDVLGRSVKFSLGGREMEATIIGVSKKMDLYDEKLDDKKGIAYIPITLLDDNSDSYTIDEAMFLVNLHVEEAKARLINYFGKAGIDEAQLEISYVTQINRIKSFLDNNINTFLASGILWFFAAIVGLINIMLVDIERTGKYYGLLKFYGNTEKQIRKLVLGNALIIGLVSGVLSIVLGLAASNLICYVLNIPIFISIHTLTLGILLPEVVCLAAAVYPSFRAARVDMDKVIWQFD